MAWPLYNSRLGDAVADMTEEQLAIQPAPERWPLWASVGQMACRRVFWLCDFAGKPGGETTPFTNAGYDCPGDDDLEHVLSGEALLEALDSTFRIIEGFPTDGRSTTSRRSSSPGVGRLLGQHARLGDLAGLHPMTSGMRPR